MSDLKFRNLINIDGKPVPYEGLDEKTKQEVSGELSKRFYNAVGLDVTLDTNIRKEESCEE